MAPGKPGPQALGSLLTYLRRYTFAAMVGLVGDVDDDGETAEGHDQPTPDMPPLGKAPSRTNTPPKKPSPAKETKSVSQAQIKRLYALIGKYNLDRG